MVPQKTRKQLMVEFVQSYRTTGQLFFKLLHTAVQEKQTCNMACLPILKVLKQQGSMSQSAIARELHHSDAAVSRQVTNLADDGLVSAVPDEHNRRALLVTLTSDGEKLLEELETTVTDFLTEILSGMPDVQLQQLIDNNTNLQTIITNKLGKEPRAQ